MTKSTVEKIEENNPDMRYIVVQTTAGPAVYVPKVYLPKGEVDITGREVDYELITGTKIYMGKLLPEEAPTSEEEN